MKRYLRRLSWFATFSGLVIPGYSTFFKKLVPPLFPEIGWITAGLAAATVFAVYSLRPPGQSPTRRRKLAKRGVALVATSVILLVAFLITLRAWTVKHPRNDTVYQIGFRTASWSLTVAGKRDLHHRPAATPEELMFMEAAFHSAGPAKIWVSWSIYLAGFIILVLYLFGFVSWSAGFATFAVAGEEPASSKKQEWRPERSRSA